MDTIKERKVFKCEAKVCLLKERERNEKTAHVCEYCTQNKLAVYPQKDYSTAIKDGGY
jgi:hypothetical protein